MVADNRLAENSVWDDRLLAEQLKSLSEVELDFSLDVTGLEVGEIDVIIEGTAPAVEGRTILPMCCLKPGKPSRSARRATCGF